MSIEASAGRRAIQLDYWSMQGEMITVTPRDHDRFSMRMQVAIELLQKREKRDRVTGQISLLFRQLAAWLKDRNDIQSAYVTLRDGELAFVVVHDSETYDAEFEDELSDLDIQIANDVDLPDIEMSVFSLPMVSDEALDSFLHTEVQFKLEPHEPNRESPAASRPKP